MKEKILNKNIIIAEACDDNEIEKRIDGIKKSIINQSIPVLVIEATSMCNLKCSFCGMHSGQLNNLRKEKKNMNIDLFNEIMNKLKQTPKFKVLYLHGQGEPLLNSDIIKMIGIAKEKNVAEKIVIVTNGVLLNKKIFERLVDAGVDEIRVSLDAISPEKYSKEKGVNLVHKVIDNIEKLILNNISAKNMYDTYKDKITTYISNIK